MSDPPASEADGPVTRSAPQQFRGRPADRIVAGIAAAALIASTALSLWFFAGFAETDPQFKAASSAFLLSALLGAFAIIPAAVVMRLAWLSWRRGFRVRYGLWSLFLAAPWLGLAALIERSDWLPDALALAAVLFATPVMVWATVSVVLALTTERRHASRR